MTGAICCDPSSCSDVSLSCTPESLSLVHAGVPTLCILRHRLSSPAIDLASCLAVIGHFSTEASL